MDIETLRQRYPDPRSQRDTTDPDAYCVAGAVCLGFAESITTDLDDPRFPGETEFANVLADLNPALDEADAEDLEGTGAWEFANAIIEANDMDRDFDAAWELVRQALAYRTAPQRD